MVFEETIKTAMKNKLLTILVIFICLPAIVSAAIIKIGYFTDPHAGDTANSGIHWKAETLNKMPTVMTDFNTEQVDVIVNGGDFVEDNTDDWDSAVHDDGIDLLAILNDDTTYPNLDVDDVPRLHCIGNHDFGTITKTTALGYLGLHASFVKGNATGSYGYYDVGNLRIVILDSNFDENGDDYAGLSVYFSNTELSWLENTALNTSKYVICFHHHTILSSTVSTSDAIQNADTYLGLLSGAKVVMSCFGHGHWQGHSCTHRATNSEGTRILLKHLCPMITGSAQAAGTCNWSIIYVDDTTGEWYIKGGSDPTYESGNSVVKFTGAGANENSITATDNYLYYNKTGSWSAPATMASTAPDMIVIYNENNLDVGFSSTFLEDGSIGWGGGITEVDVASNWTIPIGGENGSTYGFYATRIGLLELNGGFAGNNIAGNDLTWFCVRGGIGKVLVGGHGGNGGKHILINNNLSPYSAKSWWDVEVDTGDDTYEVEFGDHGGAMDMKAVVIDSGIVRVVDVDGLSGGYGVVEAEISGGFFYLDRDDDDQAVSAGNVAVNPGGTFDLEGGSNAGNGKLVNVCTVTGSGQLKQNVANITINTLTYVEPLPGAMNAFRRRRM